MSSPLDARISRLLGAVIAVTTEPSPDRVLQQIVESAVELVDATYGALGVLDPAGDRLEDFFHVGMSSETVRNVGSPPEGKGILGALIVEPQPVRLADLTRHADSYGFPAGHPPMTSFLGVPIHVRGKVFGNLYLTDKHAGREFTSEDEELVVGLAAAAGAAIESSRLTEQVLDLSMLADRERIARDLHDTVIQRIFATGLTLQASKTMTSNPDLRDRLDQAARDLDDTVAHIRTTIFELEQGDRERGLRHELSELTRQFRTEGAGELLLRFDGPVDTLVPDDLVEHAAAAAGEALANAVRHGRADHITVAAGVADDRLTIEITDDGEGFDPNAVTSGHGLVNLTARASSLGGTLDVRSEPGKGTIVLWSVPFST